MPARKTLPDAFTDEDEAEVQRQIASNPIDAAEASDEELASARPFAEAFPDLAAAIKKRGGRPRLLSPLQQISIRLEPAVVAKFKATGPGWQRRINDILKRAKV